MKRLTPRAAFVVAFGCLLALLGCGGVSDSSPDSGSGLPSASDGPRGFDPTATRMPHDSKSLTLSTDWQPPSPRRTQPARR